MAFSALVETLNIFARRRQQAKQLQKTEAATES